MDTKRLLGLKIKELRKERGYTQEHLAEQVDLDVGYISKLEVGRNFPTIGTLEKIARVLDVELYQLFLHANIQDKDYKSEIMKIRDTLNTEKQFILY